MAAAFEVQAPNPEDRWQAREAVHYLTPRLKDRQIRIVLRLIDRCGGGECFPSIDRLAHETYIDPRDVRRELAALCDRGLIAKRRWRRSNVYAIHWAALRAGYAAWTEHCEAYVTPAAAKAPEKPLKTAKKPEALRPNRVHTPHKPLKNNGRGEAPLKSGNRGVNQPPNRGVNHPPEYGGKSPPLTSYLEHQKKTSPADGGKKIEGGFDCHEAQTPFDPEPSAPVPKPNLRQWERPLPAFKDPELQAALERMQALATNRANADANAGNDPATKPGRAA